MESMLYFCITSLFLSLIEHISPDLTYMMGLPTSVYLKVIRETIIHELRTADGLPPVTYAIAAQETEGVRVSECPCFGISGNLEGISANDMWKEIKQVGPFALHRIYTSL